MAQLMTLMIENALGLIFAVSLAARLGLPVPAAPVLVVAGALVSIGLVSLSGALLVAVLGKLIGDGAWFYAGRRWQPNSCPACLACPACRSWHRGWLVRFACRCCASC